MQNEVRSWRRKWECGFNGPRILLEGVWKGWMAAGCRLTEAPASDDGRTQLTLTWTPTLPLRVIERICAAADVSCRQVVLAALCQSLMDHFKQLG